MGLHPHEHLSLNLFGKEEGAILSIHPVLMSKLKIKGNLTVLALKLSSFENREIKSKTKYLPLPKFPSSEFDCTVVVDKTVSIGDVILPIKKLKIQEISSVKIVDTFELSETQQTITIKTKFLDRKKTLDGKFLDESKNKIVQSLELSGFPLKQ